MAKRTMRHRRPRKHPPVSQVEPATKMFAEVESLHPAPKVIRHTWRKQYRVAWVPTVEGEHPWAFAAEDTTPYRTREAAETAIRYLSLLLPLHDLLRSQDAEIAVLKAANEADLVDLNEPATTQENWLKDLAGV